MQANPTTSRKKAAEMNRQRKSRTSFISELSTRTRRNKLHRIHTNGKPARATLLIVITQIVVAYGIELFGLFGVEKSPFEWKKLFGALIAIAGIIVFN